MPSITTLLLAFVQSATEFLPVSSSGHLILMEKFGISNQSLLMDISLHVGTLIAVMFFFRQDIYALFLALFKKIPERRLLGQLIVATLPACIAGFFLESIIESTLRSVFVIAFTSIFYGILLWYVDKKAPNIKKLEGLSYKDAFIIGCAQALALIPGTSRSGITMTCGRFLGINRVDCARFSMLLSIPIITLGAIYMFYIGFQKNTLTTAVISELNIGIFTSACFGLLAVWFLMKWLQKASFALFAVYRILLGCFLLYFFL